MRGLIIQAIGFVEGTPRTLEECTKLINGAETAMKSVKHWLQPRMGGADRPRDSATD